MLKQHHLLLVGLLAISACDAGGSEHASPRAAELDRATARHAIWNPGPGDPTLAPEPRPPSMFAPGSALPFTGGAVNPAATKRTLVLYDRSGSWGALGELYAIGAANLASHFGTWTSKPVVSYTCGELASYDALLYIGSTYDEPLPACLLDNVLVSTRPVVWAYDNIWQLSNRAGYDAFVARYGWYWTGFDFASIGQVTYKGHTLNRYAGNGNGLLGTTILDGAKATVLAQARRADGTTLPWAVRAGNLTYVADIPFTYMTEEDRYLVYADLLFDALAPATPERHRIVMRLEDISPVDDPAELRAAVDYLYAQHIPFGVGVISEYRDPLGWYNDGHAEQLRLDQAPALVSAVKYALARGGVLLMHGYTHQRDKLLNPYTAVSGDDTEFYRVFENLDHSLTYAGPLPGDTQKATLDRIASARKNFQRATLAAPQIFEFPHYAASATAYKAASSTFATRWERALYFPGLLAGTTPTYQYMFGQLFPYLVRDVYGTRVVPENLGNIEPVPFYIFPTRFPADIVNAAEKNLVVRDGTAGFYFHTFFDLQYLKDTVDGVRALGYEFVSPNSL